MKNLLLILSSLILVAIPAYARKPARAVQFHKHMEDRENPRYGTAVNRFYLHGMLLNSDKHDERSSIMVLVEREVFAQSDIGDTLHIKRNRFLGKTKLLGISPRARPPAEVTQSN